MMLITETSWITPFYLAVMLTAGTFGYNSLLPSTLPLDHLDITPFYLPLPLKHLDITPFYLLPSITSFYVTVMLTAGTSWIMHSLLPGSDADRWNTHPGHGTSVHPC
jgi:hypothetical protein